jgi:hypothetical protein
MCLDFDVPITVGLENIVPFHPKRKPYPTVNDKKFMV